jgi:hypothetical protein
METWTLIAVIVVPVLVFLGVIATVRYISI